MFFCRSAYIWVDTLCLLLGKKTSPTTPASSCVLNAETWDQATGEPDPCRGGTVRVRMALSLGCVNISSRAAQI
jgi:hypothetical protein